jgi:monoamine oxidase
LAQAKNAKELKELSFLHAFGKNPPVWWTQHPAPNPILTCWVGGPAAKMPLKDKTGEQWLSLLQELAELFSVNVDTIRALLIEAVAHDWSSDSFSRGAYSYVSAGALDGSNNMAWPVARTLYFAGEHTDTTGHWGTVHGAMRSGLRAARQVLKQS